MSSSGPRGIPPIQLSESLYHRALERAGVQANSLPPAVVTMLKTRLEEGLQQELETEFDRRYLKAIDTADHRIPPEELIALERQVAESLTKDPLSEAHLLDRTKELAHKIFFGSPRTLDTALKTEPCLEKDRPLPSILSALIGEYILGENGSYFDLQDALQACENFAGTGLEPAWIRQIEHFVLSRLEPFEKYRDVLTPKFGALLDEALPVLRKGRSPDGEYLQQIRGWLQRLEAIQEPLLTTARAIRDPTNTYYSPDKYYLLVNAILELGYSPHNSMDIVPNKPHHLRSMLSTHAIFSFLRRFLPSAHHLNFKEWFDLLGLFIFSFQDSQEQPPTQDLLFLLRTRPEWQSDLPSTEAMQVSERLIPSFLKWKAPLAVIEPLLLKWCECNQERLHVLTCLEVESFPLERAVYELRPDVVRRFLQQGISPYTTSCYGSTYQTLSTRVRGDEMVETPDEAARRQELLTLLTEAESQDLSIQDLERTRPIELAPLVIAFFSRQAPAHALFGISPQSMGGDDLDQRYQILLQKLSDPEAEDSLKRNFFVASPSFNPPERIAEILLQEAADLIRSGKGAATLP